MTETLPTLPGVAPKIDEGSNLACPSCGSLDLVLGGVDQVQDAAWVNHTVTCTSCNVTSQLALVGFGHRVVTRWLVPPA